MTDLVEREGENMKLLRRLMQEHRATSLGDADGFFKTTPDWRCPCCYRFKPEISRLDKNSGLLCRIVEHHDHFADLAASKMQVLFDGRPAVISSFERFSPTLICQDCNVAEPRAKMAVDAPAAFSFAPHEIAGFITRVAPNAPHDVDIGRAQEIYDAIFPSMELLSARLRATLGTMSGGEAEPLAEPVARIMRNLERRLKEKKGDAA